MTLLIIILSIALLIVLISLFKTNTFVAFTIVSILAGIALGIPLAQLPSTLQKGI
jgi:Gnt-I system high-affinity gluconate transporter